MWHFKRGISRNLYNCKSIFFSSRFISAQKNFRTGVFPILRKSRKILIFLQFAHLHTPLIVNGLISFVTDTLMIFLTIDHNGNNSVSIDKLVTPSISSVLLSKDEKKKSYYLSISIPHMIEYYMYDRTITEFSSSKEWKNKFTKRQKISKRKSREKKCHFYRNVYNYFSSRLDWQKIVQSEMDINTQREQSERRET